MSNQLDLPQVDSNQVVETSQGQSIIILRHEGQSFRNISRTLKVSSSEVVKTNTCYDETGSHEDRHRKGRPRITSAAEDKFIRVTILRNCSPNEMLQSSSNRHISTSTVQRSPSWLNCCIETTTKGHQEEKTCLGQETQAMDIRRWKSVLWSDETTFLVPTAVSL